jgi:hypothetical protein
MLFLAAFSYLEVAVERRFDYSATTVRDIGLRKSAFPKVDRVVA